MEVERSTVPEVGRGPDSLRPPSSSSAPMQCSEDGTTVRLPPTCTRQCTSAISSCATWGRNARGPVSQSAPPADDFWIPTIKDVTTYPANVPPLRGYGKGPRAGDLCPNSTEFDNRIVLGHRFNSEVILLAVDMPPFLDAPFMEPSGRAVWYSFGTLMAEAGARVLQINPDEVQIGVRPMRDSLGRIQGEAFIYDNVPGGAGYARAIQDRLHEIVQKALEMGRECPNQNCNEACYHCLLGYRNQRFHNLLDRNLAVSLLEYILEDRRPSLPRQNAVKMASGLNEYMRASWTISAPGDCPRQFAAVFRDRDGTAVGLRPIHPMTARPTPAQLGQLQSNTEVLPRVFTSFDLLRRPFWVANQMFGLTGSGG